MEIRYAIHPDHAAAMDTEELREHFLIRNLFPENSFHLVYSYNDRLIVGGVCPLAPKRLEIDSSIIGSAYLLERREMGVVNIGGPGTVTVDGQTFSLSSKAGLYIGMGAKDLVFASDEPNDPARFYLNSAPAHATWPTAAIGFDEADAVRLGDPATANCRTIRKYIHPAGIKSCQLVMGMTTLEPGSVWNTMPTHTHERRMEAYLYFDLAADQRVFHLMGTPDQTRHLVLASEEAVLSPSWSIHSGVGTSSYTFIWGMAGENQLFDDMDHVAMADLR